MRTPEQWAALILENLELFDNTNKVFHLSACIERIQKEAYDQGINDAIVKTHN